MEHNTSRGEAERLLGIAEKLLQNRDLNGSRDFAILAQETEPLLEGSDQILAVVDVLLAADRRINNHHDWYAILQLDRRFDDLELIKKQYRRLALLLHPDKNKFAYSDAAFKLVADAWAVLSDGAKKNMYDNELTMFSRIDLMAMRKQREFQQPQHPNDPLFQQKLPVRRNSWETNPGGATAEAAAATRPSSFWTTCPYCYNLYQYPKVYEGCCLRCQNCQRAFHAAVIPSLPPLVTGKDAYYCCWGFFPMGFAEANAESVKTPGFPNWTPAMAPTTAPAEEAVVAPNGGVPAAAMAPNTAGRGGGFVGATRVNAASTGTGKKRGRPRKNLMV